MAAKKITTETNKRFTQRSELLLIAGMLAVVAVILVPMPTFMLDMMLAVNLAMAVLLLLVTLNAKQPLEVSVFPSLLLLLTIYRLAINVATTRMILSGGEAGKIVSTFGSVVVGNSLVVGIVIFLILVIIQFVVITKGATRISEVNARFILDALPGKQMAIDAELGAQTITKEEAQERRQHLASEAEFYGAMDGASKYVRGDAIAGLIITAVNIIGGVIIGVMQGLDIGEAVKLYSMLTIGDGLVSQIPALIIATTAGILVTKASSEESLGHEIGLQMFTSEKPLIIGSVILLVVGLMPGFPKIPFVMLAVVCLVASRAAAKKQYDKSTEPEDGGGPSDGTPKDSTAEDSPIRDFVNPERVLVELGLGLSTMVDPNQAMGLQDRIVKLRKDLAREHGFWVPAVRIKSNPELQHDQYKIWINGRKIGEGNLKLNEYLAIDPGTATLSIEGESTIEPAFGLEALWVSQATRQRAEIGGYTVVDAPTVLITHLSELFCRYSHELLGSEDLQLMLKQVEETAPSVIAELKPEIVRAGTLRRVLSNLLAEKASISSLENILESAAHHGQSIKQPELLTDLVRQDIGSIICQKYLDANGELTVVVLDPKLESRLREKINDGKLSLAPAPLKNLIQALQSEWEKFALKEQSVAVMTDPILRRPLREAIFRALPDLGILSFTEISKDFKLAASTIIRTEQVFPEEPELRGETNTQPVIHSPENRPQYAA